MTNKYHVDDDLSSVSFESTPKSSEVIPFEGRGQRNTWDDDYTARKVVFPDGQIEVSVARGKHFVGPAYTASNRAKRGESENRIANDADAGKAAKKRVRQACKTIRADRMVTLTYRENMQCRATALKHWKAFTRRLRKCQAFHYVAVMELQERGAIHFHVAVHGRQCYQLLRSIWQNVVGRDDAGRQMAQVNVRDPHRFGFGRNGVHKLAAYIAKYCAKAMECRSLDEKRYFCSRGIPKPEVEYWRLGSDTMLAAVETAFAIASDGELDGMQVWCNNALGVVWIATAPSDPGNRPSNVFDAPF